MTKPKEKKKPGRPAATPAEESRGKKQVTPPGPKEKVSSMPGRESGVSSTSETLTEEERRLFQEAEQLSGGGAVEKLVGQATALPPDAPEELKGEAELLCEVIGEARRQLGVAAPTPPGAVAIFKTSYVKLGMKYGASLGQWAPEILLGCAVIWIYKDTVSQLPQQPKRPEKTDKPAPAPSGKSHVQEDASRRDS